MWILGKCVGFWFSVVLLGFMTKFLPIMFSLKFSVLVDGGFDRNRVFNSSWINFMENMNLGKMRWVVVLNRLAACYGEFSAKNI